MIELAKRFLLPCFLVIFLFAVFLDQNNHPIPVKLILGPPVHISLSILIAMSMTFGALLAVGIFLLIRFYVKKNQKPEGDGDTNLSQNL